MAFVESTKVLKRYGLTVPIGIEVQCGSTAKDQSCDLMTMFIDPTP